MLCPPNGLGSQRQRRSAARARRGRTPRHRLQAGLPEGQEVARVPRPEEGEPRRASSPYLLSGIAKCETCGKAMTAAGAKSGKYTYYICHSLLKRGKGACETPRLNAKKFEKIIVDEIRENVLTESNIRDLVKLLDEEMDGVARDQRERLQNIEEELEDVKKRLARIWNHIETTDTEPSGVTGPDRTASTPTERPVSPAQTPTTPGSGDTPTATDAPGPAAATPTAPLAASGSAETDREALVALYNATDGPNWIYNDNWLSDAPLGEWRYVTTNDDGRVTELRLTNALSGEIPPELGSLSNLTGLVLSYNELSGEIPAELGSLSNLTTLEIARSGLSGCVPGNLEDQLASWSDLGGLSLC